MIVASLPYVEHVKKKESGYDYMYIRLLMGFISGFFHMDGQHWFEL
jgi:hypothetical protein